MSHFSKTKTKLANFAVLQKTCQEYGYSVKHVESYRNEYQGSSETVSDVYVIKDQAGKTKLVVSRSDGTMTVDPYYMGRQYEKFTQDYVKNQIQETAMYSGHSFECLGFDSETGDMILAVTVAY